MVVRMRRACRLIFLDFDFLAVLVNSVVVFKRYSLDRLEDTQIRILLPGKNVNATTVTTKFMLMLIGLDAMPAMVKLNRGNSYSILSSLMSAASISSRCRFLALTITPAGRPQTWA